VPITQLDNTTALIVIDLQKGIIGLAAEDKMRPVVQNAARLTTAFRQHGVPVVLVHVEPRPLGRTERAPPIRDLPPDFAELLPELNQQPTDHLVTKRSWGAFMNTGLDAHLKQCGVTQIVLAGVSTSIGVESTARQAFEHGYHVTLATDAMADLNDDAHTNSVTRIFPRLGETGTTLDIVHLLDSRST
jgi:nicotinamidase-related amidase